MKDTSIGMDHQPIRIKPLYQNYSRMNNLSILNMIRIN